MTTKHAVLAGVTLGSTEMVAHDLLGPIPAQLWTVILVLTVVAWTVIPTQRYRIQPVVDMDGAPCWMVTEASLPADDDVLAVTTTRSEARAYVRALRATVHPTIPADEI
ncbi:hypothetical protein ACN20G_36860 (plasmid) [Streptomyces sp. BI20]|uniref:hypothetical protein n=1 Tax=Streptomyces sp. BI20 TaxID=3403460 RepID=UPI003C71EA23